MTTMELYQSWLDHLDSDDPLYAELSAIAGNEAEITDRFYQEIVFGTAGLRGICGAGTNRMNRLTVGRATQGIANYILQSGESPAAGVVIAYDCRYHSREFSELAAEILAGSGIRVYLFPSLRPTPELSYAIRKLGTVSGINMTASHNPKEYNGYKVYWKDGAQISGNVSDGMLAEIQKLSLFDAPEKLPLEEAVRTGMVTMLGREMDTDYLNYVLGLSQRPDDQLDLTVPIVYTPLNGAGSIPMQQMAAKRGFVNFTIVPEQKDPDPDFTTVPFPNPENPKAFALAEKLGNEKGAEVLIATDPDSDRMAIEIADGKGGYIPLNGNQTGGLLIAYLAQSKAEKGLLGSKTKEAKSNCKTAEAQYDSKTAKSQSDIKPAMIKSIVTGNFGRAICEDYGISVFESLTGFKNICGRIPELEEKGYTYFFGYEESIGCAPGEAVRDKDGIAAGMLIAEIACWCHANGKTIADYLEELYQKYGYYAEDQVSIVLTGKEGQERIGRIMDAFRKAAEEATEETEEAATEETTEEAEEAATEAPKPEDQNPKAPKPESAKPESKRRIGNLDLSGIVDYLHGYEDIPPQNAMKFTLPDGSWFALRPSGTEPKIKFYYYAKNESKEAAAESIAEMKAEVGAYIQKIE